ncbi:NAD(P)/FAD-dependent oxidoreductase [soil metagenome]
MLSAHPTDVLDLCIIGGGPVGLFAGYYAGLRKMSMCIIDSLDALGGQLTVLYPEKYIYDVAGFPKILAKDLARNLIEQVMQYQPHIRLGQRVHELTYDEPTRIFTINSDHGHYRTRAIVIAAGIGSFTPKTLTIPGAEQYVGHGLYYSVPHVEPFLRQKVLIVGGGDSAVDWANALVTVADSVTLIHRRDGFRAHEESVAKMRQSDAKLMLFHELKSLHGVGRVERAVIYDNRTKNEQSLDVDAVLVNIGYDSSLGPITHWGLDLDHGKIKVDTRMHTSRPGVFAAGDVATHPGKLNLIATGFGEAAVAVNFAKVWMDPSAKAFPGHSSEIVKG